MAHEDIRDQLITLASSSSNDPGGFLEGLSPIHDAWHREGLRTYGFLLFHNRVVRYFNLIVGPALSQPVEAYTPEDFNDLGVPPFNADTSRVDTLAEMVTFSDGIENWHNGAHGGIAAATGTPMMDPRQNIFFLPFWRLHLFIDDRFVDVLRQYATRAHPGQFVVDGAIAGHIETRHHGWVPRI